MMLGHLAKAIEPAHAAEALRASQSTSDELGDYFYMFVLRTAHITGLQFLGRFSEAAEVLRKVLDDADATSNRCAALQATAVRTNLDQVERCCSDSRARLDAERSELPTKSLSVLHLLHVLSVLRTACMTREYDWAFAIYAEFKPKYEASPLKRSAYLMCLLRTTHARLMLNQHVESRATTDPEPLVSEHILWLTKKAPLPFRRPTPLRLRARVAAIRGEQQRAVELFEESIHAHLEIGSIDEAERDRYALALLQRTDTAPAIAALRRLGVRDPEREIRGYYPELLHGA
jgi:hypothetical protein